MTNGPFQIPSTTIPTKPSLADALNLWKKNILLALNCHHVGTIQFFDKTKQVATVTINYKKTQMQFDATAETYSPVLIDYPVLVDCPVIFLGGGPCSLTFPVAKGDECLILFNDRDMDDWFTGNPGGQPPTPRLHAFSDAIALVGVRSLNNILQAFDDTRAVLQNGTTMVGVGASLVKVANNNYTLNQLLQELVNDVKSLVSATAAITVPITTAPGTSGPPLNAATITAVSTSLTTTANKIAGLLE